jgi:hypothetical protein
MAAPARRNIKALTALQNGIRNHALAVRWQAALAALPPNPDTRLWQKMARLAGDHAEDARMHFNTVRVALGGGAEPDPADPPPVRPDD